MVRRLVSSVIATFVFAAAGGAAAETPGEMLMFTNGQIYTGDRSEPWVEALAARDGIIIARGSEEELKSRMENDAKIIDLKNRIVIPGLNDNHVHVQYAARDLANYNCWFSQYSTLPEILSAVEKCAEKVEPGEWIIGSYWNSMLYDQLEQTDAIERLDAVSGGHPVILRNDTIHDRWVNSRALQLANITAETPNPHGGIIGKDPDSGELNGLLIEEPAFSMVVDLTPLGEEPDNETKLLQLKEGVNALNAMGVTGFIDAKVSLDVAKLYSELDRRGELTARVGLALLIEPGMSDAEIVKLFNTAKQYDSEKISTRFAKLFIDGVMVSRTAVFLAPYLPNEKHGAHFHGESKFRPEELNRIVKLLHDLGISTKLHTAGDGSVKLALDAIERARELAGTDADHPVHTLAHAGYVSENDLERLAILNVAPDASPTVWYPGPILEGTEAVIGKERARQYWPFKSMIERGILVAGGSDWKTLPGEFSDLWSGIEGAVTRRNPTGQVAGILNPDEAIDVESALQLYTLNSAKVMGLTATTGSLEVGKSADLIVLDQNIFEVSPDKMSETTVLKSYFNGRLIYEKQ